MNEMGTKKYKQSMKQKVGFLKRQTGLINP
jgi:hypothetical protein